MFSSPDVAVIGAGPVGCVSALAFANEGARVVLLEGQPRAARRLAGEWLHPLGAAILDRLGIAPVPAASGYPAPAGFVLFPDDRTSPIVLSYPDGALGLSCEHHALVSALRDAAAYHPGIHFLPFAQVNRLEGERVSFASGRTGGSSTVLAGRIVGADGRCSIVRKWLGLPTERTVVSYMAGVLLEDAELPFEGYGHVLLGGPGPVFVYRIGPRHLRACLDVPSHEGRLAEGPAALWDAFGAAVPASLGTAFRRALQDRPVTWAANQVRPRAHYGRDRLALVGDAVGCVHPLTAVGMTLGLMDGECLARSRSFEAYQDERAARTRVPEALAAALYRVFTGRDETAMALRRSMYELWREDPAMRWGTIRLLSAEDTGVRQFGRPVLRVAARAAGHRAREVMASGQWRPGGGLLDGFRECLRWLAAGAFPRLFPLRYPERAPSCEEVSGAGPRAGLPVELRGPRGREKLRPPAAEAPSGAGASA